MGMGSANLDAKAFEKLSVEFFKLLYRVGGSHTGRSGARHVCLKNRKLKTKKAAYLLLVGRSDIGS